MTNQSIYYNRVFEDAKQFSEEILQMIKLLHIDLDDTMYKKYIITDENRNEWIITKNGNLEMLEISVFYKKFVDNKPIYKSAWVYNKKSNNNHFIIIDNLHFHVNRTVND
jgi:hypothetical protein